MISFEAIQTANELIKTIEFKGSDYAEVAQRVKAFRFLYPDGTIKTELVSDDGTKCVFKATVEDHNLILGTGYAYEIKDSSYINKTSYIENCETSAVGRALAFVGLGIDVSIASAEEVKESDRKIEKIKKEQPKTPEEINKAAYPSREEMIEACKEHFKDENLSNLLSFYKVKKIEDLDDIQLQVAYGKC